MYPLFILIANEESYEYSDVLLFIFKNDNIVWPIFTIRLNHHRDYNIWSSKGSYACFDNSGLWNIEIFLTEDIIEVFLNPIIELGTSKLRKEREKRLLIKKEKQGLKFETEEDSLDFFFFYSVQSEHYYFYNWINDSVFYYSSGCCGDQGDYLYLIKQDSSISIDSYEVH